MTAKFPNTFERHRLNSIARRFTRAATGERRADLDTLLDEGVRFLTACADAGMSSGFVVDTAKGLHDELSNLMGAIDRDLDNVGEQPAPPLETCELKALFATPRFANVACSQCGQTFGAGDEGFSHCHQHAGKPGR
jgi:hypothetical protein